MTFSQSLVAIKHIFITSQYLSVANARDIYERLFFKKTTWHKQTFYLHLNLPKSTYSKISKSNTYQNTPVEYYTDFSLSKPNYLIFVDNHDPWVPRPDRNQGKSSVSRRLLSSEVPEQCWKSNLNPAGLSSCPAQNGIKQQQEREKERERGGNIKKEKDIERV